MSADPQACFYPGREFEMLHDGLDGTPEGGERVTPAGSIGWLSSRATAESWNIHFDNGASLVVEEVDLLDSSQFRQIDSGALKPLLLRLKYQIEDCEQTLFDDNVVGLVQDLVEHDDEIMKLVEAEMERQQAHRAKHSTQSAKADRIALVFGFSEQEKRTVAFTLQPEMAEFPGADLIDVAEENAGYQGLSMPKAFELTPALCADIEAGLAWAKEIELGARVRAELLADRQRAADQAFQDYEFGPSVVVEDTSGWESTTPGTTWTRAVYVRPSDEEDADSEGSASTKISFEVQFAGVASAVVKVAQATNSQGCWVGRMAA